MDIKQKPGSISQCTDINGVDRRKEETKKEETKTQPLCQAVWRDACFLSTHVLMMEGSVGQKPVTLITSVSPARDPLALCVTLSASQREHGNTQPTTPGPSATKR